MAKSGLEEGPEKSNKPFDANRTQQVKPVRSSSIPPTPPRNSPVIKRPQGMGTKELVAYLASILGIGVIGFFLTPAIPDEILVQALIALAGLARQRYLSKK